MNNALKTFKLIVGQGKLTSNSNSYLLVRTTEHAGQQQTSAPIYFRRTREKERDMQFSSEKKAKKENSCTEKKEEEVEDFLLSVP